MANPPLDARIPSNSASALLSRAARNLPAAPNPAPRFSDFQFRTIGQQPEPVLWPVQSLQSLTPPENHGAGRLSLQDRLSSLESLAVGGDDVVDVTMEDPLEIRSPADTRSIQNISVLPIVTPTSQEHGRQPDSSSSGGVPTISATDFPQSHRFGESPNPSQNILYSPKQEQAVRITTEPGVTSTSDPGFPIMTSSSETQSQLSPPLTQTLVRAGDTDGLSTPLPSGEDVHSLMTLRALQSRLASFLSNFNPISTANALATAQSAKEHCTEIMTTADRAYTLAQQALLSAQDSMAAAQECLNVAATTQNRIDLVLSAVENIRSDQNIGSSGEWEHNTIVEALKDEISELAEWIRQEESKLLRQLEDDKIEKRKEELASQHESESNTSLTDEHSHDLITHNKPSSLQTGILETSVMTVEDEADAATRAWNQHREQSAERKRLAEEELRKRREAEEELERQRLRAQSEVDAREAELERLRAERLKAEEEEKSRQEKEALELQRQQQELEIARFLRSQKQAQEDLAKVATEKKRKVQAAEPEKEARSIAQYEQKRKEIREKEIMMRQEIEKAKALLAESEAKRREKVRLERMKRAEVQQPQPPPATDPVASILDKAKEKQSMAISTADICTPPPQYAVLPSALTHIPPVSSSPNHAEFGNVVSKKTLLTNSPRTSKQQNRTLSGSTRLDQSSNLTSSDSSIPKTSIPIQEESHEAIPSIPSSVNKPLLSDHSTPGMESHIREADSKPGDGPLNGGNPSPLASMQPIHIPNSRPASSNDFGDIHMHDDPYTGNLSVVPPSRVLPISAEVQHANLRPFMDANGIARSPGTSDVHEQIILSSGASQPTEKPRRKPLSSSQMNGDQVSRASLENKPGFMKKPKLEPLDDVPILSIPSPPITINVTPPCDAPAKTKSKLSNFRTNENVPSNTTLEAPSSSGDLPTTMSPSGLFPQPAEPGALANLSIVSEGKVRPAAVRRNVPPLASNQQTPIHEDAMNHQASDLHVSPRMSPDAAVSDGWAQPVPMLDDVMAEAPRKQLPRKAPDRYSPPRRPPSVGSQNRLLPSRPRFPPPRISDHYSPPRRKSPLPKYNEDRRSVSPEEAPVIGRKRYRDDNSVVTHPPRRYRYNSPADATYGRSPSPESRPKSLALRLESEKPSWKYHGGSSYRPTYNNSDSYSYDPQSRSNKNQRYSAPHSQSTSQGSSYHGEPSVQSNQNDAINDTHLPLLSRFTDSAEQTNHRGSRGGNQALEQRISKPRPVSLINRLEDAK